MSDYAYRAPRGVWASSPQRKALYAIKGVLHKLEKAEPEKPKIDEWASELEKLLLQPFEDFDWQAWYHRNVTTPNTTSKRWTGAVEGPLRFVRTTQNDPPPVPAELKSAWESLPQAVRDQLWPQAGQMRTAEEGLPFDAEDLAAGLASTFKQVQGVTDTTASALRKMMKLALEEREGPEGFERRLRHEFEMFAKRKAYQVAVTEWARAASTATLQGYRATGVQYKSWFTFGDDRVCPDCEENEAQGDIPINQTFSSGDDAPPAHVTCRCSVSSA